MIKESDKKNADFQRGWDAALQAAKAWHEGKAKQAMVQSTRTRFPKNSGTRGGGSQALRGTDRHTVAGRRLTPGTHGLMRQAALAASALPARLARTSIAAATPP